LGNADLLAALLDALPIAAAGRVTALEAVTAALGNATSGTLDDHRWGELAKCASTLAAIFLAKHGGSYDAARGHLHEVLDLASARTENATISPFRRHPAWRRATCLLASVRLLSST
ncbi:MAG: hypothetical protein M3O50_07560, partial [Myxococcota bacterium]|nr:hypothetical protein [Myxococcota bacterium]